MTPEAGRRPDPERGGFVLGLVVLFLFTIAMAATAGYQVVNTEFTLAQTAREGQKALVVARGGLERFLGEQIGMVGDSVSWAIGDGIATVTTRKVLEADTLNHLYYVRSEGTVADLRTPNDPARRVVATYAWHRMSPMPDTAAIFITDRTLEVAETAVVSGLDSADVAVCPGGGTAGVIGVATGGAAFEVAGGDIDGNPTDVDQIWAGFAHVVRDSNLRWDILSDPSFPVEYDGTAPDWSALPADSFPLSRHVGTLVADGGSPWSGGRGALIVTGRFRAQGAFRWSGIILAGRLDGNLSSDDPEILGMIVAGFNGAQDDETLRSGHFRYHSCNVYAANRALSYLERVDHAVFEVN